MGENTYTKEDIKPLPESGFFQNFAGVYCKNCEEIFALYSYSIHQPDGVDEESKAFYNTCFLCDNKTWEKIKTRSP